VAGYQQPDHVERLGHTRGFLDGRELGEFPAGARRGISQRADAFRDQIERVPQLGVLVHEHEVQGVEHRPFHVPVEVVSLEIERVGVGEHARQTLHDLLAVPRLDADVDQRSGHRRDSGCDVFLDHGVTPHAMPRV
jgi:hypothetical protein